MLMSRRRMMEQNAEPQAQWDYVWTPDAVNDGKNVISTKRVFDYFPFIGVGESAKITLEISADAKGDGFIASWDSATYSVSGIQREKTMVAGVNTYDLMVTANREGNRGYFAISGFYSWQDGYVGWRNCAANYIKIKVEYL